MTQSEGFEAWWAQYSAIYPHLHVARSSQAYDAWLAACAWQKQEDLEWVMAYRRDCGCADKIAAAIRTQGTL